jgi:hypothetical protein
MKRRSRRMRKLVLVGMILLVLAGIGVASAAASMVESGGFEEPRLDENTGFVACPAGIVEDLAVGGAGIDHTSTSCNLSEGSQSLELSREEGGSISQAIPTSAAGTYTLSFDIAGDPACDPDSKLLMVYWGNEPAYGPYSSGYPSQGSGGWVTVTLEGLPGSEGTTHLTFEDVSDPSSACGVALDTIIVKPDDVVPAPQFPNLALPMGLLVGILGSAFYIRNSEDQ